MLTFVLTKCNLREDLLFCFHLNKKKSAEGHWLLFETCGDHHPSIFKLSTGWEDLSDNFGMNNQECEGRYEKFEDTGLKALLNEDSCKMKVKLVESLGVTQQVSLCLKAMVMF